MCNMQSTTVEILSKFETNYCNYNTKWSTTVEILSKFETGGLLFPEDESTTVEILSKFETQFGNVLRSYLQQ